MAKNVTIYTTNTCAYCHAVKDFFKQKDVAYEEVNLDEQPEQRQAVYEMSGQLAVPVIIVTQEDDSKSITVGYNVPQLSSALGL